MPSWGLAAFPIFASAYGFSQEDAKTDDDFFLGFPSYWNVLAMYLWMLDIDPWAGTAWTIGLSIAVFIPLKYVYPSKLRVLRRTTLAGGMLWSIVVAVAVLYPQQAEPFFIAPLSLVYPAYYIGLSFWLGGLHRST